MTTGWFFPLLALIDYSITPNTVSIYEDQKLHQGIGIEAEVSFLTDRHLFFLYSQNRFFTHNFYSNSIIQGWRYGRRKTYFGFNVGYDRNNFLHYSQHQLSYGFELKNKHFDFHVRNYYPVPKKHRLNYFLVKNYPHTDIDFSIDFYPLEFGYGIYFDKDFFGLKGCIGYHRNKWNSLLSYRFDEIKRHNLEFSIAWDIFNPSKKSFHYQPYFMYKKIKFEPLLSNLPSTPFLVDPQREEEAPSFEMERILEDQSQENNKPKEEKEEEIFIIGGFDIGSDYFSSEPEIPIHHEAILDMSILGESLKEVTPPSTPSDSIRTDSISPMESSGVSDNYEQVPAASSPVHSETSNGWEKVDKD